MKIRRQLNDAAHAGRVRWYRPEDGGAVARLHRRDGWGGAADGERSLPREAVTPGVPPQQPPAHCWVAEAEGRLVGTVRIRHDRSRVARLHGLHVEPGWQQSETIRHLLKATVDHCRREGYLKLVVEPPLPPEEGIELFSGCGLRYTRCRGEGDVPLLEFYIDLYCTEQPATHTARFTHDAT